MARTLFLLLVLVGALAAIVSLIVGFGLVQVGAIGSEPADVAAVAPPASGPSPAPPDTATRPATGPAVPQPPSTLPATPAVAAAPAAPVAARPPAPVQPVVAAVPVPPAPVVLRGSEAKLHGPNVRVLVPEGDVGFWETREDFVSWVVTPPPGVYHVDVVYSGGAESGGKFSIWTGKEDDPRGGRLDAVASPTGGWNDYRVRRVGQLVFGGGKTVVEVRAAEELSHTLMNLRRVELVPLGPGEQPVAVAKGSSKPKPPVPDDGPPTVTGLTLVEAATGRPLCALASGMRIDLGTLPPVSVRAETAGRVKSVQFVEEGQAKHPPESNVPFSIAGDANGVYAPWKPEAGYHTIGVVPYSDLSGRGEMGKPFKMKVRIQSSMPIELGIREAALHGDGFRLEWVRDPTLTGWTREQDWVDWDFKVASTGSYKVELLYSCPPGGGGEFVLRAGETKATVTAAPTGPGGTDGFHWVTVATARLAKGSKGRLAIKPAELKGPDKPLMNLRAVRLTPVPSDEKVDEDDDDKPNDKE